MMRLLKIGLISAAFIVAGISIEFIIEGYLIAIIGLILAGLAITGSVSQYRKEYQKKEES